MTVHGAAKARFDAVRDAFENNLESGLDQGAAFAVVYQGHVVVDLWGGHADAVGATPWARDTLVNVWSTTKGVASLAIAMLVDRDRLDYEAPASMPECGSCGTGDPAPDCCTSCNQRTSPPAQNALSPAPVRTITPTSGSALASATASAISVSVWPVNEFIALGRLIVIHAAPRTRSCFS